MTVTTLPWKELFGRWRTDPSDPGTLREFGDVTMEFRPDGSLTYVSRDDDKAQVMYLTFEVRGRVLVTNQPSSPREERTVFEFISGGKLILHGVGGASVYVRDSRPNLVEQ